MTFRTYDAGPSLRDRLDKLDDRQIRLLVHFLDGAAQGETREQRWLRERMREGVEWLQGKRKENEDETGNRD